jgi:hypothetical protein
VPGCARAGDPESGRARERAWKTTVTDQLGDSVGMLTAVRVGGHKGFDRMVFEFSGPLPGYRIEYLSGPVTDCGAGHVIALDGTERLSVRFYPANAHTEMGQPTLTFRELGGTGGNILQLKQLCDFEAVVIWVAGLREKSGYEVVEMKQPNRLVIDVLVRQ